MQTRHASYDPRMLDTLPALLLYFGFLALTLVVGSRVIQGPWLFLLRSFFPNWRFYHRVGQQALLQWRVRPQAASGPGDSKVAQQDWSAWQSVLPRAQRQLSHLLYNPHVNLKLANQNQLDHLVADLREHGLLYDRIGTGELLHAFTPVLGGGLHLEFLERRGGYDGYGAANTHVRLAAQAASRP